MSDEREVRKLVEDAVTKGATTVEEIHRSIAEMPLSVLERIGLFEQTTHDVRKIQETSIGAIYDLIRDVTQKVSELAGELLEQTARERDKPEG